MNYLIGLYVLVTSRVPLPVNTMLFGMCTLAAYTLLVPHYVAFGEAGLILPILCAVLGYVIVVGLNVPATAERFERENGKVISARAFAAPFILCSVAMFAPSLEWAQHAISFLLGDGAGAAVVGPSDTPSISKSVWGSDGSQWDKVGMTNSILDFKAGGEWPTLVQEGRTVFRWAVWEMVKAAKEALEEAGITVDQLSALVTHQANMRIVDEFAKQLELPESVVVAKDIETTGNTSAASIPLAMHRLLSEQKVESGGLALQIGFGAGLAYAAQVVVLP